MHHERSRLDASCIAGDGFTVSQGGDADDAADCTTVDGVENPVEVITVDGSRAEFDSETPLHLRASDGRVLGGRFASIHVSPDTFAGRLFDGTEVQIARRDVRAVEIGESRHGASLRHSFWVLVGAILAATLVPAATVCAKLC